MGWESRSENYRERNRKREITGKRKTNSRERGVSRGRGGGAEVLTRGSWRPKMANLLSSGEQKSNSTLTGQILSVLSATEE